MENATKAIIIGASIVITLAIVTIGFTIYGIGRDASDKATEKIGGMANSIMDGEYEKYHNTTIRGSEVVRVIKKIQNSGDYIGVQVTTHKAGSIWYVYDASNLDDLSAVEGGWGSAQDVRNKNYINPSAIFKGTVLRDSNDRIAAISFEQESAISFEQE